MDSSRIGQQHCSSPDNVFFAINGPDLTIRVYFLQNGKLMYEYQPSKQLSAPVSALQYSLIKDGNSYHVLSLGTIDGRLILYNLPESQVVGQWRAASGEVAITSLQWLSASALAVLTSDSFLTIWDVVKQEIIRQFSVSGNKSMCKITPNVLAVSSQCIELVHIGANGLKKKRNGLKKTSITEHEAEPGAVLRKLTGHASETTCLLPVLQKVTKQPLYLISASQNDIFVYIWDLPLKFTTNDPNNGRQSLEVPRSVLKAAEQVADVRTTTQDVAVVSLLGTLRLFCGCFNVSNVQKPLKASATLRLYSDDEHKTVMPIQRICHMDATHIIIAYGKGSCLRIEKMTLSELQGEVELVRGDFTRLSAEKSRRNAHLLETQAVHPKATFGTSAQMPPLKQVRSTSKHKDALGDATSTETLPMESIMTAMNITHAPGSTEDSASLLNKKSQAQLLLQGLNSGDSQLLHRVLGNSNRDVICRTVACLPVAAIRPLLAEMHGFLNTHWHKNMSYTLWLKEIIVQHVAFIRSLPKSDDLFKPFKQYCAAQRVHELNTLQLQTRLQRVQFAIETSKSLESSVKVFKPLIVVHDELSDDETPAKRLKSSTCNGFPLSNGLSASDSEQ
ncbi:Small-subunit processome Utp12 [Trinorchestia longiramus]|nr:Small-subunit processome Utp12 [Trinorchestia longiramus]